MQIVPKSFGKRGSNTDERNQFSVTLTTELDIRESP